MTPPNMTGAHRAEGTSSTRARDCMRDASRQVSTSASHHHHPDQASAQPSLRLNTHPLSISPAAICLRSATNMPGANYMGGKRCASLITASILFAKCGGLGLSRNAARARGKDATGKAQRNHFGKKRFEILRTGLCKGQASVGRATDYVGNASRGRPEISLAHARRDRALERQSGTSGSMLSQPFVFPSTPRRSSPRSASNRSKILTILDADNRMFMRTLALFLLTLSCGSISAAGSGGQDPPDTGPLGSINQAGPFLLFTGLSHASALFRLSIWDGKEVPYVCPYICQC